MSDVTGRATTAIDADELARRVHAGDSLTVLDVRDRDEFDQWHVTGAGIEAVQIPHQRFIAAQVQGTTAELVADLAEPLVVVCARGEASSNVATQLRNVGADAVNLAGGMEAWAREYEATELPCESATVLQYRRPSAGCLSYLVVSGDEAAVLDPLRAFADRYVADAADHGAALRWAVDTHVHADHVSGVREVAAGAGATAVLPEGATERGLSFGADVDLRLVGDGDELAVGDVTLDAVALPGHTSELVGYRLSDASGVDLLFCGDTLFLDSVARPDLEVDVDGVESMARTLFRTVQTLLDRPDDTRIAPGHYGETTSSGGGGAYVATVGDLRERLDVLSLDQGAFVDRITGSMPARPANYEEIVEINLGRESVADETAFELELGPNHCAVD